MSKHVKLEISSSYLKLDRFRLNMSSITTTDQAKLLIGAISVIPYLITLLVLLVPLYVINKKSLLGAAWKDSLLWIASIFVYYGISVGLMFIPWPGIPTANSVSVGTQ